MKFLWKCRLGFHAPGPWRAVVGGRDVRRCENCEKVLEERTATVRMPPVPRPRGSHTDSWFK